jgi:hypothetical protein
MKRSIRASSGCRLLSVLLVISLVLSFAPFAVFGAENTLALSRTDVPIGVRDLQVNLTAEGIDDERSEPRDVYAIFVVDATSSMGKVEIPQTDEPGSPLLSRKDTELTAASAYIDAFLTADMGKNVKRHVALVSFGNSARVHTPDSPQSYIGMDAAREDPALYQQADALYKSFTSQYALSNEGTDGFFSSDPQTLKLMLGNVPNFSNTNAESGIALADFLVTNLKAEADAVYSFIITDGEQAASSTLSMMMNSPALREALTAGAELTTGGGAGDGTVYRDGTGMPYLSAEQVFRNVVSLATDEGFANSLKPDTINFFAGSWHNVDSNPYTAAKSYKELMGRLGISATGPFASSDAFFDALKAADAQLAGQLDTAAATGEGPVPDHSAYRTALVAYAEYALLMGLERAPFYPDGNTATSLVAGIVPNAFAYGSTGDSTPTVDTVPLALSLLFPNGKSRLLQMRDYREGCSENVTGSRAAKDLMVQAASRLKEHSRVYAVGIGSQLVMPEHLAPVASEPALFLECRAGSDTYGTTAMLRDAFTRYGYSNLLGTEQLTITDHIRLRVDGQPVADDDSFSLDEDSVRVFTYYYDADGKETRVEFDPAVERTAGRLVLEPVTFNDGDSTAPALRIAWNAGAFYSEALARELTGLHYPYKAELSFTLTVNEGVYSNNDEGRPDIDLSLSADASYRFDNRQYTQPYPQPAIYVTPPPAPTDEPDGDVTGEDVTGDDTPGEDVPGDDVPDNGADDALDDGTLDDGTPDDGTDGTTPGDDGTAGTGADDGQDDEPADGAVAPSAQAAPTPPATFTLVTAPPPAPITFVEVAAPLSATNGQADDGRDNDRDSAAAPPSDITDIETPLAQGPGAGGASAWALFNLLCVAIGLLWSVALLANYFYRRSEREREDEDGAVRAEAAGDERPVTRRKRLAGRVIVAAIGIASLIVFILTEDMTLPIGWIDRWSLLAVAFLIAQGIVTIQALSYRDTGTVDETNEGYRDDFEDIGSRNLFSPTL